MNIKIQEIQRKVTDNFVHKVDFEANKTTDGVTAVFTSSTSFEKEDGVDYADFNSLTEEQVKGWITDTLNVVEIEAYLDRQIDAHKTPVSISGTPWEEAQMAEQEAEMTAE